MKTTPPPTPVTGGFEDLGISSLTLEVLQRMKITKPTPIQHQSIPVGLAGKDILGIAQTGTGKTLAFGIPLIQRLDSHPGKALIVLPTRELALQVCESLAPLGKSFKLRAAVLIGGESMQGQARELDAKPRVIIATPGRLIDFMEQGRVNLSDVSILVLDEADRMFDMGFAPQLNQILKAVPKQRQTLLFSATMPPNVLKLATVHMALPMRIEVAPAGTASANIEQEIFIIRREEKLSLLEKVLQDNAGTVLVFVRTKHSAKKITTVLKMMGHKAAEIHSNCSQSQRREALSGFKSGKYRILVATDIAARGIDVNDISVVINFDLPDNSEDYVHRIGRTGRAGKQGRAMSFASPDQKSEIRSIERLIRKPLTVSKTPELPRKAAGAKPVTPIEKEIASHDRPRRDDRRPESRFGERSDRPQRKTFSRFAGGRGAKRG